ncbi:MAG TPA: hypothetical protein DCM14_01480 [Clostridiales bacterium UBA8153]|nr:hypothetical protein [Clostridiales bacterium UBA8153]
MRSRRLRSAVLGLVLTAWVFGPAGPAQAGDPWYLDVAHHWSLNYVRVMWEEEVTDGWLLSQGTLAMFQPDRAITRAEYAVLLAKAFRLTPGSLPVPYLDIPATLTVYEVKPAFGLISAAYHRGILTEPGAFFLPRHHVPREVAVAYLLAGLGLEPYAFGLSPSEVAMALFPFADHAAVSSRFRPFMAAAIRLGIIRGFEDGTLRPHRLMTRAEAVVVVYRSCILLLRVTPPAFSPDGDGLADATEIFLDVLKNRNATGWNLAITDLQGVVLRTFNPAPATPAAPPASVVWNGANAAGVLLPPGQYFARGWVQDRNRLVHWSVMQPIQLVDYQVRGYVLPAVVRPGQAAGLHVHTSIPAARVWWTGGAQAGEAEARGGRRQWSGLYPVPAHGQDGTYTVEVRASFPSGAIRGTLLAFQVVGDLALMAWVYPVTASPGQRLVVEAIACPTVTQVHAGFSDGHTIALVPGPWRWTGERVLPADLATGLQAVSVTARAPGRERSVQVNFWLEADVREDYAFILTY